MRITKVVEVEVDESLRTRLWVKDVELVDAESGGLVPVPADRPVMECPPMPFKVELKVDSDGIHVEGVHLDYSTTRDTP